MRKGTRRSREIATGASDGADPRSAHERLQGQARQNQAVAALGRAALASDDLQALMDRAVQLAAATLGCEYASVMELEPDGRSLLLRSGVGWRPGSVGRVRVGAGLDSQAGFALMAGEPIVVTDLASERRFRASPLLREHPVVSGASVIIAGGSTQPYGALAVHATSRRDFSADDVHFLRAAANILAAAVRQRHAEQALRDSEERMRAVVTTLVDGVITIDERGLIDSVNPAAERLFGFAAAELAGRNVSMLMPEPYRGEHDGYIANYLRTGHAKIIGIGREVVGRRKDGTVFPMDLAVSELRVGGRRMFTGVVRDITYRRRLERETLEAAAEEQRRIGQDLHDGLCQQLTGVAFATEVLTRKLAARGAPETPAVRKVAELVDQAITQARGMARGLQPVTLEAGGLVAALEELAAKVADVFHVSCQVLRDGPCLVHDNATATHLYRITQEAVTNAIKHGKARTVTIDLAEAPGELRLAVRDDGVGLPATGGPGAGSAGKGMGLHSMAYRARIIGGTLAVRPGSRGGTTVTCVVPLANAAVAAAGVLAGGMEEVNHGSEDECKGGNGRRRGKAKDAGVRRRRPPDRSRAARGTDQPGA